MNRERLTITLRSDLLKYIDGIIDGDKLRNRSHAIEYYLSKALGLRAVKVLILAGGKAVYPHTFDVRHWEGLGNNTKALKNDKSQKSTEGVGVNFESKNSALPKAMVKIAGKPLLEHTLHRLKTSKFTEVVISLGEGGEAIKEYFGDGSKMGLNITYLQQKDSHSGTAQPLLQAKEFLAGGSFLLIYGDVLSDIDYSDLVEFHRLQKTAACTMALSSSETVSMWGLSRLQGNRIVEFEEKPKSPKTFSHLINAGIYLMEPEIFSYINQHSNKLESDVFPRLAEEGKLAGYPFEGLWLDISNSAAYKQAMKEMAKS